MSVQSVPSIVSGVNDAYRLHVVHLGDVGQFEDNHPMVGDLVSRDLILRYSRFPGACLETPVFFYLESEGRICSYLRTIPDETTIEGKTCRWAWSGDNYTFPEFRKRGLSTLLQHQATQYLHQHQVARGSVYSTDVTLHIFRKLGFTVVGHAKRFLLIRSIGPFLKAHIRNPQFFSVSKAFAQPIVSTAMAGLRTWNRTLLRGTECNRVNSFPDQELHTLLVRLREDRQVYFGMDADLLHRKMEIASRCGTMSMWLIRDKHSGECLGYMIVRERLQDQPLAEKYRDFRLMTLMDFGFLNDDTKVASGVVGHLIHLFLQSECDVLEVISSNKLVNRAAAKRAMIPVGKGMSFTYSVPESWNLPANLAHVENWPLSSFCGDAFTF